MQQYAKLAFSILATLIASAAGTANAESAEGLIQNFERMCISTGLAPEASLASMEGAGWMVAPQYVLDGFPPAFTNVEARIFSTRDAVLIGLVASLVLEGQSVPVCAVSTAPAVGDLRSSLVAWAGVSEIKEMNTATDTAIPFVLEEGQLRGRSITPNQAEPLARQGRLFFVAGREYPSMTMVLRMRIDHP